MTAPPQRPVDEGASCVICGEEQADGWPICRECATARLTWPEYKPWRLLINAVYRIKDDS